MEESMIKLRMILTKKYLPWIVVIAVLASAVTVYAVLPVISLNSPTSFPVDI
jgi:hypothetical protein